MAWTAPMTAVAGSVFTAAQFNTFVRDNLAETAPAKSTTPGSHMAVSDTNQISERTSSQNFTATSDTTTATTFGALAASSGPSITVVTGPQAWVVVTSDLVCDTNGQSARATFEITGATSLSGQDSMAIRNIRESTGNNALVSGVFLVPLTPGSNTFNMVYRTSGTSTSSFANRRIGVLPL